jgi:hypothetical protein
MIFEYMDRMVMFRTRRKGWADMGWLKEAKDGWELVSVPHRQPDGIAYGTVGCDDPQTSKQTQ